MDAAAKQGETRSPTPDAQMKEEKDEEEDDEGAGFETGREDLPWAGLTQKQIQLRPDLLDAWKAYRAQKKRTRRTSP